MSYQSPVEVFQTQIQSQIEGEIYKAVMKVGVNVDNDELLKALQYDRDQYQKGYTDRDSEIIRCKDCKHFTTTKFDADGYGYCHKDMGWKDTTTDWFCADGERQEGR